MYNSLYKTSIFPPTNRHRVHRPETEEKDEDPGPGFSDWAHEG